MMLASDWARFPPKHLMACPLTWTAGHFVTSEWVQKSGELGGLFQHEKKS